MAFRLTSASLPATPSNYKLAPFIRTFMGDRRGMGSLLTVNFYANYGGSVAPEVIPTPEPIYKGLLTKIPIQQGIKITTLAGFSYATNPLTIQPNQFWTSDTHLYLYSLTDVLEPLVATTEARSRVPIRQNLVYEFAVNSQIDGVPQFTESPDAILDTGEFIQEGATLAVAATNPTTVRNLTPIEENWIYSATVPATLTVNRIESLGLEFFPSAARPNPGEFQQIGDRLIICGSPQYRLDAGQELVVFGTQAIALDSAIRLKVATFELLTIFYIDKIEWQGLSFAPASNALNPQAGEFFWSNDGYATVFYW